MKGARTNGIVGCVREGMPGTGWDLGLRRRKGGRVLGHKLLDDESHQQRRNDGKIAWLWTNASHPSLDPGTFSSDVSSAQLTKIDDLSLRGFLVPFYFLLFNVNA